MNGKKAAAGAAAGVLVVLIALVAFYTRSRTAGETGFEKDWHLETREVDLGEFVALWPDAQARPSPDMKRVGRSVGTRDAKSRAVIDGKPGKVYWFVGGMSFSPDSKHVAYAAGTFGASRQVTVVDGEEQPEHGGVSAPVFSPDSQRVAYAAYDDRSWCIVADGIEGIGYAEVVGPYFSADSKHVVYVARRERRLILIVDGNEVKAYRGPSRFDWAGKCNVSLSPDLKHVAWLRYSNGDVQVFLDGIAGAKYKEEVRELQFSPDSQRLAYAGKVGEDGWRVVVDGEAGPVYRIVQNIVFSPDSKRVGYYAWEKDGYRAVVNGVEKPACRWAEDTPVLFSPDSARLAYVNSRSIRAVTRWEQEHCEKQWVVVDGRSGREYDRVGRPVFSPDSKHVAYAARKNDKEMCVVVDGREGPRRPLIVRTPVFSPNSYHLAWVAADPWASSDKKRRQYLVVNNIKAATYDKVFDEMFTFSDSLGGPRHPGHESPFIVVSEDPFHVRGPGEERLRVKPGIVFDDDNTLRVLALRDGHLYRVEVKIALK